MNQRDMKRKDLQKLLGCAPNTVTSLCQSETWSGPMLKKVMDVFEVKASVFMAYGEIEE